MRRYHFAEGMLELPTGWVDQTVTMLVRPAADTAPEQTTSLVINREPLTVSSTEHVDQSIIALKRTLPAFRLLRKEPIEVGALKGTDVEFGWRKDGVGVTQRTVFLPYTDVMLTITLSAGLGSWEARRRELEEILASIKLRRPEAP